jgi:hypothetical protein
MLESQIEHADESERSASAGAKTIAQASEEDLHKRYLTPTDYFMLEEYKNISAAHFDLHQGYRQMFRFYLGIVAIPVTVFAFILKDVDKNISIGALPTILTYVTVLVAIVGLLMFLALTNISFEIMFYARTVNGTRLYFTDRERELTGHDLKQYLLLPGDMDFPPYGVKNILQVYWWQYWMIALINSCYFLLSVKNFSSGYRYSWPFSALAFLGLFGLHLLLHYILAVRKEKETKHVKPL